MPGCMRMREASLGMVGRGDSVGATGVGTGFGWVATTAAVA